MMTVLVIQNAYVSLIVPVKQTALARQTALVKENVFVI
jgi:hypothetical protein